MRISMSKLILKVVIFWTVSLLDMCFSPIQYIINSKGKTLQTTSAILQFRNAQNVCFAVFARGLPDTRAAIWRANPSHKFDLYFHKGRICWLDRNICGHHRMPQQPFKVPFSLSTIVDAWSFITFRDPFSSDLCLSSTILASSSPAKECH